MRLVRILLSAALLIATLTIALPAVAQSQLAAITSPRDGAQLKGVVQIEGTATHGKFHHYELAWAPQGTENWQQIAFVQNQITNGSLGTWDTTSFQPGVYRLRLRLVRDDNQTIDVVVNNLSINQGTPTPPPSPTPTHRADGFACPDDGRRHCHTDRRHRPAARSHAATGNDRQAGRRDWLHHARQPTHIIHPGQLCEFWAGVLQRSLVYLPDLCGLGRHLGHARNLAMGVAPAARANLTQRLSAQHETNETPQKAPSPPIPSGALRLCGLIQPEAPCNH